MKYVFYEELRQRMGDTIRRMSGKSKKGWRKDGLDPVSTALHIFFKDPSLGMTLDAAVLADEEDYVRRKRRMYIPQDASLVEMLWRAKMKVDLSDLAAFPRAFSVAWPKGTVVGGVELPGCLVWFGRRKEREAISKILEKWTKVPVQITPTGTYNSPPEEYGLHISFSKPAPGNNFAYYRCSIPESWLKDCLRSADDLESKLGSYPLATPLTSEETREQYAVVKSVVHLMVYATACPESIVDGWPEASGAKGNTKKANPVVLISPKFRQGLGGTHGSPEAHWRDWHFRSYPRKRDGTKKQGMVFVHGCLVMGDVDPKTVVQIGGTK